MARFLHYGASKTSGAEKTPKISKIITTEKKALFPESLFLKFEFDTIRKVALRRCTSWARVPLNSFCLPCISFSTAILWIPLVLLIHYMPKSRLKQNQTICVSNYLCEYLYCVFYLSTYVSNFAHLQASIVSNLVTVSSPLAIISYIAKMSSTFFEPDFLLSLKGRICYIN